MSNNFLPFLLLIHILRLILFRTKYLPLKILFDVIHTELTSNFFLIYEEIKKKVILIHLKCKKKQTNKLIFILLKIAFFLHN